MRPPEAPSGERSGPFGEYQALYEWLGSTDASQIVLTLAEIEDLVGALPTAAWVRPQWWTNTGLSPQARAWLYAGWKVTSRDLVAGVVHLRRVAGEQALRSLPTQSGAKS